MEQGIPNPQTETVRCRMGQLLQNGRYETVASRHRRMAAPQNQSNLLETMEESANEDKKTEKPEFVRVGRV